MKFDKLKKIVYNYKIRLNRFFRKFKNRNIVNTSSEYLFKEFQIDKKNVFFGYYDISPFNDTGLILANVVDSREKEMAVGFFDMNDKSNHFTKISMTRTWCWQMGCRAQWYGGTDNLVLFNDLIDNKYCSKIIDIEGSVNEKIINFPIYSVARDGLLGLSLNFSRLETLRPGYGYSLLPDSNENYNEPNDDGIFLIDMIKNSSKLLLPLNQISNFEREESMGGAIHYFNHLLFNSVGSHFLFFHCWVKNGVKKVRTLISDISGKKVSLVSTSDSILSHFNWISDNEIICYQGNGNCGKGYYKYNLTDSKHTKLDGFQYNSLDGHPTYLNDILITDTVPDKYSDRHLIFFDINSNKNITLTSLFSPLGMVKDKRCDFHPRLNSVQTLISIDSAHNNLRSMLVFNIEHLVNNK